MKIRARSLLAPILLVVFLLGSKTTYAATIPTPGPKLGIYLGIVNMTMMHRGSADTAAGSTEWYIDMVNTEGNIDIVLLSDHRYSIVVDIPVPIDSDSNVTVKDKDAECKGWSISGSGFGTAKGTFPPALVPGTTSTGPFVLPVMQFALSSFRARIKKIGNCPSETWGPSFREGIVAEFTAAFGTKWIFSVTHVGGASLSGTCDSEAWGKAEGQKLECSWRAYWVPSED